MNEADVLDVLREALWVTVKVAGPAMVISLMVGVVISLMQALTQIQEQTLVFVPKILAVFAALAIFFPFMLASLIGFTRVLMERAVQF